MIRIVAFLAAVALAAFGIGWLVERPGSLVLVWQGWQIETSVPVALLAVILLTAALLLLWGLLRSVIAVPDAISGFFRGRRRKRGMTAVANGLMAIGIGDGRGARRAANEARRLIGDEPLTLLLRAQAAQLAGDRGDAESAFRAMLDQPETRPLGYRGLYIEAQRRGDAAEARRLAERAVQATPNVPWAGPALLDLQAAQGDWDGALASVERNASAKLLDRAGARRTRAVLLTAKAQDLASRGANEEALEAAREAAKLASSLVPAVVLAGRLLAERGDFSRAAKVLENGWKHMPHPDIAEVYLHLRPGDAAVDRLARAEILAKKAANHPEARLALATAALDAREFGRAREALAPLAAEHPSRRVCLLMAEIENADRRDIGRARSWLARAVVAHRDPAWVADGVASDRWAPLSPLTGRLDAFEWRVPQERLSAAASPLLEQEMEAADAPRSLESQPAPVSEVISAAEDPVPDVQEQPAEPIADVVPARVELAPIAMPELPATSPILRPHPEVLLPPGRAPDDPGPDDEDESPFGLSRRGG